MPELWNRHASCFSTIRTRWPVCVSAMAAQQPAIPPPTISMSNGRCGIGLGLMRGLQGCVPERDLALDELLHQLRLARGEGRIGPAVRKLGRIGPEIVEFTKLGALEDRHPPAVMDQRAAGGAAIVAGEGKARILDQDGQIGGVRSEEDASLD